jgi:hypothetical protein
MGRCAAIVCAWQLVMTGCGPREREVSTWASYAPPEDHRVQTARAVDAPVDAVWQHLAQRLDAGPFRVLTQDPLSRFMVVELRQGEAGGPAAGLDSSHEPPSRFVDCGREAGGFVLEGERETYESALADSHDHRELAPVGVDYSLRAVARRTDLIARATLYMQAEGDRTRISVNTRYALTVERTVREQSVPRSHHAAIGAEQERTLPVDQIRITSFEEAPLPGVDGGICRATGVLESRLLEQATPDRPPDGVETPTG